MGATLPLLATQGRQFIEKKVSSPEGQKQVTKAIDRYRLIVGRDLARAKMVALGTDGKYYDTEQHTFVDYSTDKTYDYSDPRVDIDYDLHYLFKIFNETFPPEEHVAIDAFLRKKCIFDKTPREFLQNATWQDVKPFMARQNKLLDKLAGGYFRTLAEKEQLKGNHNKVQIVHVEKYIRYLEKELSSPIKEKREQTTAMLQAQKTLLAELKNPPVTKPATQPEPVITLSPQPTATPAVTTPPQPEPVTPAVTTPPQPEPVTPAQTLSQPTPAITPATAPPAPQPKPEVAVPTSHTIKPIAKPVVVVKKPFLKRMWDGIVNGLNAFGRAIKNCFKRLFGL